MQTTNKRLELWKNKYRDFRESGLSRAAYCKKHRIPKSTLNYWFYRLRKLRKGQGLVEVKQPMTSRAECRLRVVVADRYRIEVCGNFDARLFAEVVKALECLQ